MARQTKAVEVAERVVNPLLNIQEGEDVLVVTDDSSMMENAEIADSIIGLSRSKGANASQINMADVPPGVEEIPSVVQEGMKRTDVLVGLTKTTAASVIHHDVPVQLRREGELRGIFMVKRSFEALTSSCVLDADYNYMMDLGKRVKPIIDNGNEIRVTSDKGTDLWGSLEDMKAKYSGFAHNPGEVCGISWGEVAQGPKVGTAEGKAVIDGPILEYGWPNDPIELTVEDGVVIDVEGDGRIGPALRKVIDENENADNLAEIAFGTNPQAELRETNIWKKGEGRTHIAIGNGLGYGQPVDSPVHIDLVMNDATVEVDDELVIDQGKFVV